MAYIVSTTNTAIQASGTSYTVTLGTHAANDLLLVCVCNDDTVASISTPAGWTAFGTAAVHQATLQAWFYKVASGSGTTNPTFTVANRATIGTALVIRGASATPADGWQRIDWGNSTNIKTAVSSSVAASSAGGTTQITPAVNALLIYSFSCDGATRYMRTSTSDMIPVSKVAAAGVNHIIGYRQHGQSGSPAAVTMYADVATEGGNGWVLSIADDGNGFLEKDGHTSGSVVNWYGNFGILHPGLSDEAAPLTWRALSTFAGSVGSINSISCSSTAPTIDNAVSLTSGTFATGTGLTSTESTAGAWVGGYHTLTPTDMTGKLFHLTYQSVNAIGSRTGSEGLIVAFSDGTNYVAYQLCPKALIVANETKTLTIALGTGDTYASAGSMNWGAVTQVAYAVHRIGSSATGNSFYIQNAVLADKTTLAGGHSAIPLSPSFLPSVFSGWGMYKQVDLQGSAQVLGRSGIQIGDGGTVTYFNASASSTEYPVTYNGTTQAFWNVTANATGITVKAGDDDVIDFSSCVLATTVSELFTIDAASSASATYSLAGASLVGWKVTDNLGLSWTGTTFKGGDVVTIAGGGDLTNCTIASTASANAALAITANGSTLDGTTIDVTGTSAAYHLELGTAVTVITLTDVTFTGTPGTDKAHTLKTAATVTAGSFVTGDHYEIKTVGTTDFTLIGASANTIGVRFTATGAGSGTGDAYVAVKITISGTTSLAESDVTSAGAVVWVAAPSPTLDATVLSGSRVVLYNDTTAAELDNTAPAGTSWSKVITSGASSGDTLTLHVFKEGYEEFSTSFIYAGIDNTLLVTQSVHAAIASLRTELSITDYTTITEFSLDITGTVEIDADDADGSTTKARLAIWYNGVLTTENGARYLRGAITILSTAAFRINTSILDLKIENVSVTYGLNFTDIERRLYRDDGAAIYAPASAPGSIQNDYSGVPDTVTTSDQSLNLATAEQAIDNKLSSISSGVWAYVVTGSTTAVQMMRGFAAMLLGKVSGAGTVAETFRDISDTKDVAIFTVDSSGNRTAVTRDLT